MRQKIIKLSDRRFKVWWDDAVLQRQALTLDFNSIINRFNLPQRYPDFVLLHWQARPKGLRRWGVYHYGNDQYYGTDWDKCSFDNCTIELLQMDEMQLINPPSAVVLLPNHCVKYNGTIVKCEGIT